jgi:signal transduction histidine kinase
MHIIIKPFLHSEKLRHLFYLGATTDADKNFTIFAVNSMCISIILINLVLAPLFAIITGSWNILSGAMIEIFFVAYVLFSNARHKHALANILLFLVLNAATVYFSAVLGPTSSAELMVFFLVGLGYFLFPNLQMRTICLGLTICSLAFIEFNYKHKIILPVTASELIQDFIRWTAYGAISTLIILLFTFYTRKKETRVYDLKGENTELNRILTNKIREHEDARNSLIARIHSLKSEQEMIRQDAMALQKNETQLLDTVNFLSSEIKDFRDAQDLLEIALESLNINVLEEKEFNATLTDYLFFAAHDAERNIGPIERASYYLQLKITGQDGNRLPDQAKLLDYLNLSIREYRSFISNLFYVAKCEAKRMDEVVIEAVNVKQFFTDIVAVTDEKAILDQPGINLIFSPDLPEVLPTDNSMLRQITMNLLINAKQQAKGMVYILLESNKTHFSFRVVNQGDPIPENLLARVFDKYFTTNRTKGQGVGLTIAKSLTVALGGNISVTNQPNMGPCFKVDLPYDISRLHYHQKLEGWDSPE